jgi:hypothetical protein
MQLAELLDRLGYAESPTFLRPRQNAFRIDPDFGHIFRRASEKLALQGVYTLRPDVADHSPSVPIIYVCEADDETKADDFHRLIWNQDIVPFVLIYTPFGVKLYSGFRHQRRPNGHTAGILQPLTDFNQLDQLVHDFSADVKPKVTRPVSMLGILMQHAPEHGCCIAPRMPVVSAHSERHVVVRDCTPLASDE